MASSNIKMLGMYSGWDTESIIQQMMKISQMRIDSKTRSRIALQWKQESLTNIKTELTDFRRTYLTALGTSALRISSAFNSTIAKISGKNAGAVSIATSINSSVGTLKIGQVESLAKNASVTTFGTASRDGNGFKLTDTLGSLFLNTGDINFDASGEARVHLNGANITLGKDQTLNKINENILAGGGNAIIFNRIDFEGRAYAQVNVNGKSMTMYADQAITFEQMMNLRPIGSTPITYDAAGNNTVAFSLQVGTNTVNFGIGDINRNDTLEYINNRLNPATNPLDFDKSKRVSWTLGALGSSVANFSVTVGATTASVTIDTFKIETTTPADSKITADQLISKYNQANPGDPIEYDASNDAYVTINGQDIKINRYDTLKDINSQLHGNEITWAAGGDGMSSAAFSIGHTGSIGLRDVTINTPTIDTLPRLLSDVGQGPVTFTSTDGKDSRVSFGGLIAAQANDVKTTKVNGETYVTKVNDRGINWNTKYLTDGTKYATANIWIKTEEGTRSIEINQNMTIQDMINKVNSSGAGVTMRYDRLSDQFVIENNRPDTTLEVGGLEAFGIFNTNVQAGSRARVWINDELIERNTNTFEIRGMTITLNETTKASGAVWADEDNITVSLTRDATDAIERVRAFVDSYNTIISKLESLLKENKNKTERSYLALTDEEKQNMTEKQIEEWETIAKKGMLKNDFGIQSMINSLRGSLFETIKSVGLTPSDVGLSTGRYDAGTGSQIVLDEDKLRKALEDDPEKVANLFMGIDDNGQDKGWLWRMDDIISNYVDGSQFRSIYVLEDSVRRANEEIEKMQDKMYEEEEKLYKKFAAMETALSKLQSQLDWFSAMMGTSNNK